MDEIEQRQANDSAHLYYDGACGLCHGAVRFILKRDRPPHAFRFAPLGGATMDRQLASLSDVRQEELPDSVVVITASGRVLVRSDAMLYVGRRLGGVWRVLSVAARWVPRWLRDGFYRGVARIRHFITSPPDSACPWVDSETRARFDP